MWVCTTRVFPSKYHTLSLSLSFFSLTDTHTLSKRPNKTLSLHVWNYAFEMASNKVHMKYLIHVRITSVREDDSFVSSWCSSVWKFHRNELVELRIIIIVSLMFFIRPCEWQKCCFKLIEWIHRMNFDGMHPSIHICMYELYTYQTRKRCH